MSKSYIISGGIVFFLLIILGIYFYIRGKELDNLILQKQKLQDNISFTQNKLDKEQQTLETLNKSLNISSATTTIIQSQIKQASALLSQTDFMFSDPNGLNPKIKIKESSASLALNEQRRKINLILKKWQDKFINSQIKEIDAKDAKQIEAETKVIRAFVDNFSKIMENLTVENSNLSSFQINNYITRLASLDSIDNVLISIETTISSSNNNQTVVTLDKIINQELTVNKTQAELTILQNQLVYIGQEIQRLTPASSSTTTPESSIPINSDLGNSDNYENSYIPPDIRQEPIIVQPGPPRLIQGSNQY